MANKSTFVLVAVLSCVTLGSSLKLPSYIKPCSRNDPDINACVLKNGGVSLTQLIKTGGDRKYNIPNLIPLKITELVTNHNGLMLTMRNVELFGLEDTHLTRANMNFNQKHSDFDSTIPRLEIIFDYEVAGRILVLPIQGKGPANITVSNLNFHLSYDYDLKKGKTGKDHMFVKNTEFTFEKTKAFIKLDNLFGNKELSDHMNLVLNENSEEVISDVGPAVAKAMGQVVEQLYNGLNAVVPFDDMYPEKV